ncbi:type II toxin-antitoxin system VapC family toxin [Wenzhouxiangella sp. XN79A]|uniref:type II toxin-antitoxin system VapC family toxin n=1 Tax=Wenzhouxiangella sp. XN79A TaxID=2724193 RepID=UPI00144AC209|nr:type II toxin-antitoxin system VapC family toxin [Wenzhouxiangella sp. XN79A]NKI36182.1 type II toxin-antitoxin system VapC family toxin [Wenzhouxiangella sp. XN79A]
MMYALDTNTLIYFFKGSGRVGANLLAHPPSEIAIPIVVVYEIEFGLAKSTRPKQRRQQFEQLLSGVSLLPFDRAAATRAAELRADLERRGLPIGPLDTLIAGTTLAHRATLVTHNTREFSRIPGLELVDWYD